MQFKVAAFFFMSLLMAGKSPVAAQQGLYEISDDYFRSNPYKSSFSIFLNHLLKDPTITDKHTQLKTDSTLFSFSGTYKTHNPFFYKPEKTVVILEEMPLRYDEALTPADTILTYQLIAYSPMNEKTMKDVKKEFSKIHRVYSKRFSNSKRIPIEEDEEARREAYHYFVGHRVLSPLTVGWVHLKKENLILLNITLRIKVIANEADLPQFLNNP